MNPTPEQVAQWAEECATEVVDYDLLGEPITDAGALIWSAYRPLLIRLVTRAMAEQAEADAKLCDCESEQWLEVAKDGGSDGRYDWKADGAEDCAATIRANAPKVTT